MIAVVLKGLLYRRGRVALTAFSIVLGVGFIAATFVLSDSAAKATNQTARRSPASDVTVRSHLVIDDAMAPREPLPASLLQAVRQLPGVAQAAAYVEGQTSVVWNNELISGKDAATIAASADGMGTLTPFHLVSGRAPTRTGEVALDGITAGTRHIAIGDEVSAIGVNGPTPSTVVGLVTSDTMVAGVRQSYALFDTATAQTLTGRIGSVDSIVADAAPGISTAQLLEQIRTVVPPGSEAVSSASALAEKADDTRATNQVVTVLLGLFALIALGVGGFIILNTFTVVVAQRTQELALLRAVGASRRQVTRSVLAEAVLLGVVASTVGVVAGIGLAVVLRLLLGVIGLTLPQAGLVLQPRTVAVSLAVGTVLTTFASYLPARRAGKLAPMAALRDTHQRIHGRRWRIAVGAVLCGLSFVAGPLGILLVVLGAVMVMPAVVPVVARLLRRPAKLIGGFPGLLGGDNALRNPLRTSATASALMLGLSLVVGMAIFADSALNTFTGGIDRSVKADLIVDSSGGTVSLSPDVARRLAERPEITNVSPQRYGAFQLGKPNGSGFGPASTDFLTGIEGSSFAQAFDIDVTEGSLKTLDTGGLFVLDKTARAHGWHVGDSVTMRFARTGEQSIPIVGIYRDGTLYNEGYLLSMRDFERNFTDTRDIRVLATRADGFSAAQAKRAADEVVRPFAGVTVKDHSGYKAAAAKQVDIILAIVAVLLGLAVLIAVLGIVNTLALSIYERTRELGLLRAVGMTRRQVRAMVRWESLVISLVGALLAIVVGAQAGRLLAQSQSFIHGVTYPVMRLALFVLAGAVVGVVAAVIPARRAAATDILDAARAT